VRCVRRESLAARRSRAWAGTTATTLPRAGEARCGARRNGSSRAGPRGGRRPRCTARRSRWSTEPLCRSGAETRRRANQSAAARLCARNCSIRRETPGCSRTRWEGGSAVSRARARAKNEDVLADRARERGAAKNGRADRRSHLRSRARSRPREYLRAAAASALHAQGRKAEAGGPDSHALSYYPTTRSAGRARHDAPRSRRQSGAPYRLAAGPQRKRPTAPPPPPPSHTSNSSAHDPPKKNKEDAHARRGGG